MKGCKGICSRIKSGRPFGDTYKYHAMCRRCDEWIKKDLLIDNKCPCCGFKPRLQSRKKHSEAAFRIAM